MLTVNTFCLYEPLLLLLQLQSTPHVLQVLPAHSTGAYALRPCRYLFITHLLGLANLYLQAAATRQERL